MDSMSPILAVMRDEAGRDFANRLSHALGYTSANVIIGDMGEAVPWLQENHQNTHYLLIDIGAQKEECLPFLRQLAVHCHGDVQVVIVGDANDIHFYRALIQEGVSDYFTHPADLESVRNAFLRNKLPASAKNSNVISFMSASAGDGSSTMALNAAYAMAEEYNLPTVLVDMDYQFGMAARNLDVGTSFGIKDMLEHPERGIDTTLVERTVTPYSKNLHIIAAPHDLRYMPKVAPELIRDLVLSLRDSYKCIVLDLPHQWSPWVSAALTSSTHISLIAQLWLKSVTHASRLLNVWRDVGIDTDKVYTAINRSGSKYKEAVYANDFERVCNIKIHKHLPNDIKTIVAAENQGKTFMQMGNSKLAKELLSYTELLLPTDGSGSARLAEQPLLIQHKGS